MTTDEIKRRALEAAVMAALEHVDAHGLGYDPVDGLVEDAIAAYEAALDVPVTCNNDRGIQDYGTPVICTYGSEITVRDSSSAETVACWLRVDDKAWSSRMDDEGRKLGPKTRNDYSAAHLNVDHAKAIIAALQTWVRKAEAGETPFGGLAEADGDGE